MGQRFDLFISVKPSEKILKKHKSITSVKLIKNANDVSWCEKI